MKMHRHDGGWALTRLATFAGVVWIISSSIIVVTMWFVRMLLDL